MLSKSFKDVTIILNDTTLVSGIMAAQSDLVDIIATFSPKIVRMVDDGSRED